jgi:hypothetical protein
MSLTSFIDLSAVQYTAWRIFLKAFTPNPKVASEAYQPVTWSDQPVSAAIEDEDGELWVFDAVIKLDHNQSQRITQHPVQTGANITDHSFALPAKLTLEIGMSDVMRDYIPNKWGSDTSEPTKSVAAYKQLLFWKNLGKPLKISTRIDDYVNMVVANLSTPDDVTTGHGLKCLATFQQIFTASVTEKKVSVIPQATGKTDSGIQEVSSNSSDLIRAQELIGLQ